MAIWLIVIGVVAFALGVGGAAAGRNSWRRAWQRRHNRPELTPVARGGTSHDRMEALIESQTTARRQRRVLARAVRRIGMALTVIAMLPLAGGVIILLSQ